MVTPARAAWLPEPSVLIKVPASSSMAAAGSRALPVTCGKDSSSASCNLRTSY